MLKSISWTGYRILFMHYECISFLNLRFENDVKEYGIQAGGMSAVVEVAVLLRQTQ